MKLSIIIAVYNVERYILDCLDSIFRQDLDDDSFEVIIVNDGTKDNSINVIADIVREHHNIIIVNQENQGSSVAWNNGISKSIGEYLLIVDADDLLIDRRLRPLLDKALETKADLVVADYIELDDNEMTKSAIAQVAEKESALCFQEKLGRDMFLYDLHPSHCYVWRTLYKKSFLIENNISFIPGIHFQDIPFTTECYIKAGLCIKSSQLLYVYRKRYIPPTTSFIVAKYHENTISISKTWGLVSRYHLTGKIRAKLENNVFTNFMNFSRRVSHLSNDFKVREKIYQHLRCNILNMHFKNSLKHRLISYVFCNYPYVFNYSRYYFVKIIEDRLIRLYYRCINKYKIYRLKESL